jgi:hypothetical protein
VAGDDEGVTVAASGDAAGKAVGGWFAVGAGSWPQAKPAAAKKTREPKRKNSLISAHLWSGVEAMFQGSSI